jgi:hypothetical protein
MCISNKLPADADESHTLRSSVIVNTFNIFVYEWGLESWKGVGTLEDFKR